MSFDAATLLLLENALTDCFVYHDALDSFLIRSGVPERNLTNARKAADVRNDKSQRSYDKAPKRFIVKEILLEISKLGDDEDRLIANLITGLTKGKFPDAAPTAIEAITGLKDRIDLDRIEKDRQRQERAEEAEQLEREERQHKEDIYHTILKQKEAFRLEFEALCIVENPQSRGYQLEKFLNEYFEFSGLEPRASFKIVGEQIDGSFTFRNKTNLLEAKWTKDATAGAEFGAFNYKIEGKSADTRGLFVSINGYSIEAIQGLNSKGSLRFVCIDGAHIMRSFIDGQTLPDILEIVWRHADETGEAYLNVSRFST